MNQTKTTHLGIVVALAAAGRHDDASFCNAHTFCQGRHKRRATLATAHDGEDSGPLDGEDHLCFQRRGGGGVSGGGTSSRLNGRANRGGSGASGGVEMAARRRQGVCRQQALLRSGEGKESSTSADRGGARTRIGAERDRQRGSSFSARRQNGLLADPSDANQGLTSAGEDDGAGASGELDGVSATSGFVAGREAWASVGVSISEWKAAWEMRRLCGHACDGA
ncbi:unnamed protein product [Miscanthus lutarioriparius]|uniref:Uncharacterized protein n=1 Tax=Miscanthus lutarioriparius TaxID=422564 RepID=A0A811SRE4_9POAL|nr:unnamed protein product [Miscanthus lutarioriparius]